MKTVFMSTQGSVVNMDPYLPVCSGCSSLCSNCSSEDEKMEPKHQKYSHLEKAQAGEMDQ